MKLIKTTCKCFYLRIMTSFPRPCTDKDSYARTYLGIPTTKYMCRYAGYRYVQVDYIQGAKVLFTKPFE